MKLINETVNKYGRLKPVELIRKEKKNFWKCVCDCGNTKLVTQGNLKSGAIKSCGCLFLETVKKYYVDTSQFVDIKKEEISYILGFLWADGNVRKKNKNSNHTISLEIKKEDMLEILPIFNSVGTWALSERTRQRTSEGKKTISNCLSITDKQLWETLVEYGFSDKSTMSASYLLENIPELLHPYFFRGYFDGDGSISLKYKDYPSLSFSGSHNQNFSFISDKFKDLGISCYERVIKRKVKDKYHKSKVLYSHGRKNALIFFNYVYKDKKSMGLSRKRIDLEKALVVKARKNEKLITFKGKTQNITKWSKELGFNRSTLRKRIKLNIPLDSKLR